MKTVLAFETSCPVLSVALGTRSGETRELRADAPLQHSENLIPLVDRLLKEAKLAFEEVGAFAIDRGPGSFTGLRIGFSLLKGFLAVRKRPCYGALSLDMMARQISLPEGSRLGVLQDARRDAIYARFYRRRNRDWDAEGGLELLPFSQLTRRVSEGTVLAGDALIRYRAELETRFGKQTLFLEKDKMYPSAGTLVEWYQSGDPRLVKLAEPKDFLPLYFRASEAEEKKQKAKSS